MVELRGLSEAVSAVILFAVTLSISIAGFMYVMFYLDRNQASVEFGYVKSVFRNIAVSALEQPFKLEYSYPFNYVSIGFATRPFNLTLVVNNTRVVVGNITALTAVVRRNLVQGFNLVYGVNSSLLPSGHPGMLVYEYYQQGASVLVLDPSVVTYQVVYVNSTLGVKARVTFMVSNFTGLNRPDRPPEVYGQGLLVLRHDPSRDIDLVYTNVTSLSIYINGKQVQLPPDIQTALSSSSYGVEVELRVVEIGVMVG